MIGVELVRFDVSESVSAEGSELFDVSTVYAVQWCLLHTTEVIPFIAFHAEVLFVCSLRRHHIWVTATSEGPVHISIHLQASPPMQRTNQTLKTTKQEARSKERLETVAGSHAAHSYAPKEDGC